MHDSTLVTATQLAKRYHVSVETIRAWYRRGWIPALRAGRRPLLFDPREVDASLRQRAASDSRPEVSGREGER